MLHQYLWSLALAFIPAGLLMRALALREAQTRPVPVTVDRSSEGRTGHR
jgi:hypothetical protein